MKKYLRYSLIVILLTGWTLQLFALSGDALIPSPTARQITVDGVFCLDKHTDINYQDSALVSVAHQLATDLYAQTGWSLIVKKEQSLGRNIQLSIDPHESFLPEAGQTYGVSAKSSKGVDERYLLQITPNKIRIVGATVEAVFRGCTTLRQLTGVALGQHSIELPTQIIQDAPRFAWRGLSLDVSRSFIEADEVKSVIDMMALYKFNVLHLHLTDNQGWRIEIKQYPKLTTVGGYVENKGRKGGYFTQEQYMDLVRYAAEKQITVVPELDLPGHTEAVFKSYPHFVNAAHLPFKFDMPGQAMVSLDPDDEAAMQMVEVALTEIAALTPGRFIHIGSDETFGMQDDKYAAFVKKSRAIVRRLGKEIVGWQEMARAEVATGDVLQHWISFSRKQILARQSENRKNDDKNSSASNIPKEVLEMLGATYQKAPNDLPQGIARGAKILLSPGAFAYLDCPYEEESTDILQRADRMRLGLSTYARQNLRDMYDWDPTTLYPAFDWRKDIAGVEATIFGETIETFLDMQFLLLPRLTGIAEKGWNADRSASWEDYRQCLANQAPLWELAGWNFFKSSLIDWTQPLPFVKH